MLDNGVIDRGPNGSAPWGDLVGEVEIGWASGDADPRYVGVFDASPATVEPEGMPAPLPTAAR